MTLDRYDQLFYLGQAKYEIFRRQGQAFQDFFVEVGMYRWGSDFEGRRSQGRIGDKKCDGYHVPTQTVYQCYAPRALQAKELIQKITEDFNGAYDNRSHTPLKAWALVHNDSDELPTTAHELIIALRKKHSAEIEIKTIGPTLFLTLVMEIELPKLKLLFPSAISSADLRRINFADIDQLLEAIGPINLPTEMPSMEVPSMRKLSHNGFSDGVAAMLKSGLIVQPRFEQYFRETSRSSIGEQLAERFRKLYMIKRDLLPDSDRLFFEIFEVVGGLAHAKARRAVVIGLVSYLFHTCEIFENPPNGAVV